MSSATFPMVRTLGSETLTRSIASSAAVLAARESLFPVIEYETINILIVVTPPSYSRRQVPAPP